MRDDKVLCGATVMNREWLGQGHGWSPIRVHPCRRWAEKGTDRCKVHQDGSKTTAAVRRAKQLLEAYGYTVIKTG